MIRWLERSLEERSLLNPAFCAQMIWHSAQGHEKQDGGLPFVETFLVLPFILHRATREALPRTRRTSLAVWIAENPLIRNRITTLSKLLVSHTKEGICFGATYGFLLFKEGRIAASEEWKKEVVRSLKGASNEVRDCANRADFVGQWLALAGDTATVLALLGMRP